MATVHEHLEPFRALSERLSKVRAQRLINKYVILYFEIKAQVAELQQRATNSILSR